MNKKKGAGKTDINKIKSEFLANCSSIGLPDTAISIASYEGTNHKAWWLKKKDKEELYANIAYQIKFSSTKKMDELVNKLDDYATQGFEVTRVSHSKLPEFRKQIKIQAIKAAKEKAIYLADAIGEKVGDAVTITENDEGAAIPFNLLNSNSVSYYNWKADGPQKSDSDVDFKKIKMKTGVQAVFALK